MIIRWIVVFFLAWAVAGHVLPARGSAQSLEGRVWKQPNPGTNPKCPYKSGISVADALSSDLTVRSADGSKLDGEVLAADAWSHTDLENGTTILTFQDTRSESFVIESVVPVTEAEARELGFPSYAGLSSLMSEGGTAHNAGHSPLRPRAVLTKHFLGGAGAKCPFSRTNMRVTHFQAELNEEARSLALYSCRTWRNPNSYGQAR